MKVGFLVDKNPESEYEGSASYPDIRFYLGLYKLIAEVLGLDEITIVYSHTRGRSPKFDDRLKDIEYLKKYVKVNTVPYTTNEKFDILIAGIMQHKPAEQYLVFDKLASQSDRVIYMDSDDEPYIPTQTLFRALSQMNLQNVKEKVTDILITSATDTQENTKWNEVLPNAKVTFIPYIPHPYYLESEPSNSFNNREGICTMRSLRSQRLRSCLESLLPITDFLPTKSCILKNVTTINESLKSYKSVVGTTLSNSVHGHFRVTSKIYETLHAGSLPTLIIKDDVDIVEGRYSYIHEIPEELFILVSERSLTPERLIRYGNFINSLDTKSYSDLVCKLRDKVYKYHNPEKWRGVLKEVLCAK